MIMDTVIDAVPYVVIKVDRRTGEPSVHARYEGPNAATMAWQAATQLTDWDTTVGLAVRLVVAS